MDIKPLPPAGYTPASGNYNTLQPFRFWCQKVLPLVYDDSLSYYELLCKVVDYLNKTMEDVETLHGDVTNLHEAYEKLQSYVNEYFSSLDIQNEINNKLDNMAKSGELFNLIEPLFINFKNDLTELKNRVDNLSQLSDGSTTGDAELIDGRVSWTGTKYKNIGNNIRNNDKSLCKKLGINCFSDNFIDTDARIGKTVTSFFTTIVGTSAYSEYIELTPLVSTEYLSELCALFKTDNSGFNTHANLRVYYYDANKNELTWYALGTNSYEPSLTRKAKYIRIFIKDNVVAQNYPNAKISEISVGFKLKSYQPTEIIPQYSKICNRIISDLHFKMISRLGYRGFGGNEGSIFAFKQAILLGYPCILADVNFTSDKVPVVVHDATINRVARNLNGSEITQPINISNITYEETKNYDFGIKNGISQIGATKVETVIKLCKYSKCKLYLEYKSGDNTDYDALMKLCKKYGMYNNIVLCAGLRVLNYMQKYPELEFGLLTGLTIDNLKQFSNMQCKRKFFFGWTNDNITETIKEFMIEHNIEYEAGIINTEKELINYLNTDNGNLCVGMETDDIFGSNVVANYSVDNMLLTTNII